MTMHVSVISFISFFWANFTPTSVKKAAVLFTIVILVTKCYAYPTSIIMISLCSVQGSAILGSYAGIVKGNPLGEMSGTESDKLREMASATESPPKGAFHFGDLEEYPPLTQNSD